MRITKEQAGQNRKRVVDAAAERFRRKGFDNVPVADLMRAAGLTHGGFYNHFASKADLEAEACAAAFEPGLAKLDRLATMPPGSERAEALEGHLRNYLTIDARDAAGPRCPMVAFATDVSRQDTPVQAAFATSLRRYIDAFASAVHGEAAPSAEARADAIFRLSAMVGALTLARGVARPDEKLSDEILAAAADGLASPARGEG